MKNAAIFIFLVLPILSQAQTIVSEKPLIKEGVGFFDKETYSLRQEGFPYQMEVYRERSKGFWFKSNRTNTVSIVIDFENTVGLKASVPLPFVSDFRPGVHHLFEFTSSPRHCSFSFYYTEGIVNPKLSRHTYVLPVPDGKSVTLTSSNLKTEEPFVTPIKYHDGISTFYGVEFEVKDSFTITAVRGGKVEYVEDKLPGGEMKNRLRIVHLDGSFADYLGFDQQGINVTTGDKILAGQPLGTVDINRKLFLSIGYQTLEVDRKLPYNEWLKTVFINPSFRTKESKKPWRVGESYTSSQPAALITQEMSKRQRKKYLSGKN